MDQLRPGNRGPHALIYGGTAPESQDDRVVYECRSARVPRAVFVIIQRKKWSLLR